MIKASQLLMGLVIAVLVIVLAFMLVRLYNQQTQTSPASTEVSGSTIVSNQAQQEAVAAFAAASSFDVGEESALFADERHENEHTDATAMPILIERIPVDGAPTPAPTPAAEATAPRTIAVQRRVLIYHTHTQEAYERQPGDTYKETSPWRTADSAHSIVRVGDVLENELKQRGFAVVHDVTDHEPPKLGTAYTRSLLTLEKYRGQHFDLYIDLHRDEYIESAAPNVQQLAATDRACAKLMMLIGNGEGFEEKPFYPENLQFAKQLTLAINQVQPGLCKDVLVKNGRYNQHIGHPALVIEVGNNKNTLTQAENAMLPLAEALQSVLNGEVFLASGG